MDMPVRTLEESRPLKTYRYLRIGLVGAAVMLAAAVLVERIPLACWQGSVSAYYYTPARAVFVGALVAVGLSLIVIKGRDWEDVSLNIAGMLAPVVAFVPTKNVGECWSIKPEPSPLKTQVDPLAPDVLADWVVANIENNMWALIIVGTLGLVLVYILASVKTGSLIEPLNVGEGDVSTKRSLLVVAIVIALTAFGLWRWEAFKTQAHNFAAIGMFVAVAVASGINAKRAKTGKYFRVYASVAVLMATSALVILVVAQLNKGWDHAVLVLEIFEIVLFTAYWVAQTAEHWNEVVEPSPQPGAAAPLTGG
jgi:hypothetical protein